MKKFTEKAQAGVGRMASAYAEVKQRLEQGSYLYGAYIGLDVHKETIAVAVAECGRRAASRSTVVV